MTNPRILTAAVTDLTLQANAHPMCVELRDNPDAYRVIYPAGDWLVDGVRCSKAQGKALALRRLLLRMEYDLQASYPGADRMGLHARYLADKASLNKNNATARP